MVTSVQITVVRALAWALAALVGVGVLTLVRAYRYDPEHEPVGAVRFWVVGLLVTIALSAVALALGEGWGTPVVPVAAFGALAVERHRELKRRGRA